MIYDDPCTNAEATLRHKTPLVAAGGTPPTSCRLNKPPMQGGAASLSLESITADTYAFPTAPSSSGTTVRQRNHAQSHHLCPHLNCAVESLDSIYGAASVSSNASAPVSSGVARWALGGHLGIGAQAAVRARWLRATCTCLRRINVSATRANQLAHGRWSPELKQWVAERTRPPK